MWTFSWNGLLRHTFGFIAFSTCWAIISGVIVDDEQLQQLLRFTFAFGRVSHGAVYARFFSSNLVLRFVPRGLSVDGSLWVASRKRIGMFFFRDPAPNHARVCLRAIRVFARLRAFVHWSCV